MMIDRQLQAVMEQRLRQAPVVVLLGPRQVGWIALARAVAGSHPGATLLDLEQSDVLARRLRRPDRLVQLPLQTRA